MSDDGRVPHRSLADKLNHLYAKVIPAGRNRPYTDRDVAEAIGGDISASYLNMLRTGRKSNPTMRHLNALAKFFGVPPAYFFDEDMANQVDAELARLKELRELRDALNTPEVRVVALKARNLSPTSLARLGDIIDHIRQLEHGREEPDK